MYGLIWRILPGPWASKFIMAVGLLAGGAALLWFFAFPAISPHMPFNDGAVDTSSFGGEDPADAPGEDGDPSGGESGGESGAEEITEGGEDA
ncbi:hypothetical protein [Nocardiopsis sp. MG754419]|uniref:hypothetical protein n=1 Tax=Nocardiopsis sp. MG754419 TaxID=2259865 RepID=UPI001BAA41B4|nr:hypothetical protein [Nocardiopsis sp. MG754419]MBR8744147.1 hypothetical protein [Nocardiopsis sp. MG754419]